MSQSVVGWVDAYLSDYSTVSLTDERRRALVERIRKRGYNFTYEAHQTLPYCAPLYKDKVICVLNKQQWDSVMDEAYGDMPRGSRLMPMDAITRSPKNGVLYEKEKFQQEGDGGNG
jgi:hypothetical protein